MKKIFLLLVLLVTFSCNSESTHVRQGRESYMKYLKKVLRDPNSLTIYNEKYTVDENGTHVKWEVDFGAKNGMGGMVREEIEFETSFAGTNLKVNGRLADESRYLY